MLCRACDCEVVRESVLLQDESRQYVRGAMQVTIRRDQRKHSKTKNKLNQQKRYLLCAKRMELVQFQQMNLFSRFFSPTLCWFHWLAPFYVFLVALICLLHYFHWPVFLFTTYPVFRCLSLLFVISFVAFYSATCRSELAEFGICLRALGFRVIQAL